MLEGTDRHEVSRLRADARPDPLTPYFTCGSPQAPLNDLPRFGHRHEEGSKAMGACFRQGYDITFVAPKDLIIIFMNGYSATEAIDGEPCKIRDAMPGDIRWHPAGTLVHAKTHGVVAELAGISTDPDLREEMGDHLRLGRDGRAALNGYALRNGSIRVMRLAQAIRRAALRGLAIDKMALDGLCIDTLRAGLACVAGVCEPKDRAPRLGRRELGRAVDYIDAHLSDNLTIKDVARQCGLTQPHFTTAFKETTGLTPYQYLLERRLVLARDMLLMTESTTAAVAYDCGFSSQAHMTDLFRKKLGVTPARFRKDCAKRRRPTAANH